MGGRWIRIIAAAVMLLILAVIPTPHAYAQAAPSSGLKATINAAQAVGSKLTLTNISGKACQVATTARGTVAVTSVKQKGVPIQPIVATSSGAEDIGYLLQQQLKTLQPGHAVDLKLPVYKVGQGHVLRATTWSAGSGSFTTEYRVTGNEPLELELNYGLPITPAKGPTACAAIFASTDSRNGALFDGPIPMAIVAVAGICVLALVAWLIYKRRRHTRPLPITSAIIAGMMLGLGLWLQHTPSVQADVTVPPDVQATYNGCIDTFNANPDIAGPILGILNDPANHFQIVRTDEPGSDMTGLRNPSGTGGIFTIYWNPDDTHRYYGTGGYPEACSVLLHELYHAYEQLNGSFSRDACAGSRIETKEVHATRAENRLRERLGLSARSHYGDQPLPAGDCTAPPAPPTTCTGPHCGDTNGDPHLRTFDGLRYDFQSAGEFILARDPTGDYEIQTRQEPWSNSRLVTINTASAFKVGKDQVEVRSGQPLALFINGKRQALKAHNLPDGGSIRIEQGVIILGWKDGSLAYVRSVGSYGVAVAVQPSEARSGKLEGLLGDANGNSNNDLRIRRGKAIKPVFEQLYPIFADSWRVTNQSSLFTYDKGKDTDDYTIRDMPDKPVNTKSLVGYAAAEAYCKNLGISDPVIVANCALDMAITGRPEFAQAALTSQVFTAGGDYTGTVWDVAIKKPGDSAAITFEGKAGEHIFVQIPKTTLPTRCGVIDLLGPDNQAIKSGCIINNRGYLDTTALPTAGTFTIRIAPGGDTGNATVRLLRISPKRGTITPDGQTVRVSIDQPGVTGHYTFDGKAGQRIYIDVPSSTLKSQCGILRLLGPNGQDVGPGGCIINNKGNLDTTVLPVDGQYTILVDPQDVLIGEAMMRLVMPTASTQSIAVNGPARTASLTKPGSVAFFTFTGSAGQRIYIDLPSSNLPSQCGLLTLRAPDGDGIGSGCVINGRGNLNEDGITLPATGTYAITLDPNANDTGKTTIRIRSK